MAITLAKTNPKRFLLARTGFEMLSARIKA